MPETARPNPSATHPEHRALSDTAANPRFPFPAKPVVAMAHFPPLPGAPGYDRDGGLAKIMDWVAADLDALQAGGVDAVMFGNEGDRPYTFKVPAEGVATMAAIIGELKPALKVPFGVNVLWDPSASVALAAATGATFVREIFTGVYAADMGVWAPDAYAAMKLRSDLGRADDLALIFNINAEFAAPLDTRAIAKRAQSAVFSAQADIIAVSGPMTGEAAEQSDLRTVKQAVGDTPVFANTGVRAETVADVLSIADGCVVGTALKHGGDTWAKVDPDRVRRFMDAASGAR